MSALQEHFLGKYFAYRDRYVAYIAQNAPRRVIWAINAEIARLSFVLFGALLCAVIFWFLVVAAVARSGWIALSVLTFLVCGALATWFGLLAAVGMARAVHALSSQGKRPSGQSKNM